MPRFVWYKVAWTPSVMADLVMRLATARKGFDPNNLDLAPTSHGNCARNGDNGNTGRARNVGPCFFGCQTTSSVKKNGIAAWSRNLNPSPWPEVPVTAVLC